uniref:Histone acetyltransferase type B catalytic subunit n=1 Tax=Syphacia muris TaxID=451379 RepID=A0A0N5AH68_9BILA
NSVEEIDTSKGYNPEFAHQHFGQNEIIFGYSDLSLTLAYTSCSMYIFPQLSYKSDITSVRDDIKPDNVYEKLREQLPSWEMNAMVSSKEKFRARLEEQEKFEPYGELVSKFTSNGKEMQIWKVVEGSETFNRYLARVQTLALWYIDAAQYTDNDDPRWNHYFMYETSRSPGSDATKYVLAGYCSICNFYCYPEHIRPRIGQIMLLPQYRRMGNGAKFLQCIYNDLKTIDKVKDITVEDPAYEFVKLRDYVDCLNCGKLDEFTPEELCKGFTDEMKNAAREKLKINFTQCRRVYEILRYMHTDIRDAASVKAFRIDVKRRLEKPLKRSERDWRKIARALDERELAAVVASQMLPEKRLKVLQQQYEELVNDYKLTISRLKTYPNIF